MHIHSNNSLKTAFCCPRPLRWPNFPPSSHYTRTYFARNKSYCQHLRKLPLKSFTVYLSLITSTSTRKKQSHGKPPKLETWFPKFCQGSISGVQRMDRNSFSARTACNTLAGQSCLRVVLSLFIEVATFWFEMVWQRSRVASTTWL